MKTLDLLECAEFLKVDRTTVLRLATEGEIPGAKIGRSWVFLLDEMVEYLRSKTREQQRERQSLSQSSLTDSTNPLVTGTSEIGVRRKGSRHRVPVPLPEVVG